MSRSSKNKTRKIIGITMGDPCGVGPEVTVAAIEKLSLNKDNDFLILGNEQVLNQYWSNPKKTPNVIHLESKPGVRHIPGVASKYSAMDSLLYLSHAVKLLKNNFLHSLVTAPVSKEAIIPFSTGFKGHTTFLADAFNQKNVEMLFVAQKLKVVLLTRHVPVKDLSKLITSSRIQAVVQTTAEFIKARFKINDPCICICGLNPHAGEGGHIGNEEIKSISPAISKLKLMGHKIIGPLPADSVFEPHNSKKFDLIVAMYHDQALTALKAMYFNELVNLTVGLPFIRTSPAHGTAFAIAGKNLADYRSMKEAISLAMRLS